MAVELPRVTTVEGMYSYILWGIVLLALVVGAYLLTVYVGAAPPPERLYGATVAV